MEEKQLNEKESLELITRMIRNTQQRIERGNGIPFLIWGYTTVLVSLLVWFTLKSTQNYYWNLLWFLIPVIGFTAMTISMKKEKKGVTTYIDKVIMYVWIVIGIAAFIPAPAATIMEGFPILFIVTLLISIGTVFGQCVAGHGFSSLSGVKSRRASRSVGRGGGPDRAGCVNLACVAATGA